MSTNPCPSFYRRWNAGKELTAAEVAAVVANFGFAMKSSQICQRQSNAIGPTTVCDSKGTDGEYHYLLNVTSPDENAPQVVTLIIRPHHYGYWLSCSPSSGRSPAAMCEAVRRYASAM